MEEEEEVINLDGSCFVDYNCVLCLSNPGERNCADYSKHVQNESRVGIEIDYPTIYLPSSHTKFDSYSYKNNDTKLYIVDHLLYTLAIVCVQRLIKFLLSPNKLLQNISSNKNSNGNDLPLIYVAFNKRIFHRYDTSSEVSVARKIKP